MTTPAQRLSNTFKKHAEKITSMKELSALQPSLLRKFMTKRQEEFFYRVHQPRLGMIGMHQPDLAALLRASIYVGLNNSGMMDSFMHTRALALHNTVAESLRDEVYKGAPKGYEAAYAKMTAHAFDTLADYAEKAKTGKIRALHAPQ